MSTCTIKISNVSLSATDRDLKEFFSFSGDIVYVEMKSDTEESQIGYVTFKDTQGAETAVLLSGATIVDLPVVVTLDQDYTLPPNVTLAPPESPPKSSGSGSALSKAEDMVSSMVARGFVLGKDALGKAKSFDEKHQLSSTASAKVVALDKRIGLTEKIGAGTAAVSGKVREVDEKFHVTEKTKTALAAAEQKVSNAGSALMKNKYVFSSAAWVSEAFNKVTKAAKEKAAVAKEEENRKVVDEFARVHLSESPKGSDSNEQIHSRTSDA